MKIQQQPKNASQNRQRLWVVTELYYPEMTSTGYYLTKIAEGLTDDFEVKALCGQPNYLARGTKAAKREIHNKVEIFRAAGTTLDKNVIPFRIINMLTLSFSIFLRALRNFRKGDKILVVTNPPSMPFIAAIACLIKGGNYTLLIHDNYPEILIAAEKARENSFFVKMMNHANRWLYKYAAKIIVCGRDMNRLVTRKTEGLDVSVVTIQNWAELESVRPYPRAGNALLRELGIENKLVFLYAGNMGYPNDLESILVCAEKLKGDERFAFVFLGGGVKRKWLEREVANKKLTNVRVLDPQPRSEQNVFLNGCDVGIVTLVKKMRGVSVPSRTYNILAVGKPILALTEDDSEVSKVIDDDNVGWTVPPGEPDKLLKKILEIYESREKLNEMGAHARRAALEKYSFMTALEKYKTSLK